MVFTPEGNYQQDIPEEFRNIFEKLFEEANEMIITTDKDGYIKRINKRVEEVSGYSREELKGESILKIADSDDRDEYIEFWERILDGENPRYTIRGVTKDDEVIHMNVTGTPIRENDEIVEILYNAQDISELKEVKKELDKSKERFKTFFESNPDPAFILDTDGKFVNVNEELCTLVNLEEDELVGKHFRDFDLIEEESMERALKNFERRIRGKDVDPYTVELTLNSGEPVCIEVNADLLEENGETSGVLAIGRDVTERKKWEKALRTSEKRFRQLFELNPDPAFLMDPEGVLVEVNEALCDVIGYEKEEIVGKKVENLDILIEDTREKITENLGKILDGKDVPSFTIKVETKSGETRIGEVNHTLFEENGEVVGVLGIARDITERKRSKEKLRKTKERFENLFEEANELIVTTDPEGNIKRMNKKAEEMTGYSEKEVKGENILSFAYEEDKEEFIEIWKRVVKGEFEEMVVRIEAKDGEIRWMKAGGRPIMEDGEVVEIQYNGQDITNLKEAEERARKEGERFEKLFRGANHLIITTNKMGYIRRVNEWVEKVLGYSEEDLKGEPLKDIIHPEDREKGMRSWEKLANGNEVRYELKMLSENGEPIYVTGGGTPIKEDGEVVEIQFNAEDITDRIEAERQAKREKERYEDLFEGANELIITTDKDGYVERVNKRIEEYSGYSKDELVGESILKIAHPDDEEKYIEFWKEILNGENPRYELKGERKDGSTAYIIARGRPIIEDGEVVEIQYNAQDITRRVQAEEEQEFLFSLLRHDLRNKISVMEGYQDILKQMGLTEEQQEYVSKSLKASQESLELIEKVSTLSKLGKRKLEKTPLNSTIKEAIKKNKSEAVEMGIDIEYEECDLTVLANPLLEEIFSNMVENSIQHSEGSLIKVKTQETDEEAIITLEDDGKGIPDEEKEKIFDQGFRSGENAGTGLGLNLVKRITERYGGNVEVEDSDLGGAKFVMHLQKA